MVDYRRSVKDNLKEGEKSAQAEDLFVKSKSKTSIKDIRFGNNSQKYEALSPENEVYKNRGSELKKNIKNYFTLSGNKTAKYEIMQTENEEKGKKDIKKSQSKLKNNIKRLIGYNSVEYDVLGDGSEEDV